MYDKGKSGPVDFCYCPYHSNFDVGKGIPKIAPVLQYKFHFTLQMCMGMGFPMGPGIPWEWE